MHKLAELLDQLNEDDHILTARLWEMIYSFYRIPRLRKRLIKLPVKDYSPIPTRDMAYLLSALAELSGCEMDSLPKKSFWEEATRYLQACENLGASVQHFLKGTTRRWDEIRPRFQEMSHLHSINALRRSFPKAKLASDVIAYFLSNDLLRLVPVYPFHSDQSPPVLLLRPQPELNWSIVEQNPDCWLPPLCNHFPDIDWIDGSCDRRRIWLLGVRVVSRLTPKTARILRKSLAGVRHLATTRVSNKRKILILAFYSQADLNLFKFNLVHYSKLYGSLHQFVNADLSEYRKGCPGFSGFFDDNTLEELFP